MEEKTNFNVFGIPNAFFLLDDYFTQKPCIIRGIKFPSVRHAVLSHKVRTRIEKLKIAETKLPADLKDFEATIPKPEYWAVEYILEKLFNWTLYKFMTNEELGIALKNTGSIELVDNLKNSYGIEELKEIENYRGKVLMDVRKRL
jgi:predicted NAD-dependent protein-ADP-ribosyltransferase YbiA (DUF1768 family)